MPANKRAAFRYRVLNECFTRPGKRRWTKMELLEELNRQLSEHFDAGAGVGLRTLEADLSLMRSDPPRGFAAPIRVREGLYYYDEPDFSIARVQLSPEENLLLKEAFALLRQFPGLPQLPVLENLLQKTYAGEEAFLPSRSLIQFEGSPPANGIEWIAPLYDHIRRKEALAVSYRPFTMAEDIDVLLSPYLLKEWRNRWYVVGWNETEQQIWNLALDRIRGISRSTHPWTPNHAFDPLEWYRDIVGVTRPQGEEPREIRFSASPSVVGYLVTKPIHSSQKILEENDAGTVFSLFVIPNPELWGELRRFGPEVQIQNGGTPQVTDIIL